MRPAPRKRPTALGPALALGLAAAGFVAGAMAVDRAVPRTLPLVSPKLDYFESRKDDYTAVFLGTSTTYRHVIPDVFAAALSELGAEARPFNFGIPALSLAEALEVTNALLGMEPQSLEYVVVDVSLVESLGPGDFYVSRNVWAHTTVETARYLAAYVPAQAPWRNKLERVVGDLTAWARNATGLGRVAELFRGGWDPAVGRDERDIQQIVADGYRAIEDERGPTLVQRREDFQRTRARFDARVAAYAGATCRRPSRYYERMLERIVRRVQEAGASPILYEPPTLERRLCFVRETLGTLPVLSLKDPDRHPALYDADHHFDTDHLTARGARILSRQLARAFARHLEGTL